MNEILKLTVSELSEKLASRELSSVELTQAYLDRIDKTEETIGAYITVCGETALKAAAEERK